MIPPDVALKLAICRYGPIVSAVLTVSPDKHLMSWDPYFKRFETGEPNPNWSKNFPDGIFRGIPSSKLPKKTDHEVLLVGWDDKLGDRGCWIIKNSWGTNWGDEGYMKLPYGCNNIGFAASWVMLSPPSATISATLAEKLRALQQNSQLQVFYPQQ